jgi:hypothetical protein
LSELLDCIGTDNSKDCRSFLYVGRLRILQERVLIHHLLDTGFV